MWGRVLLAALVAGGLSLSLFFLYEAQGSAPETAAGSAGRRMGYGAIAHDWGAVTGMGFGWVKESARWRDIEPTKGAYSANALASLSGMIDGARSRGLSVMVNVAMSPRWASGSDSDTAPPINAADLADFAGFLAGYLRGRVAAYEIWNEPNLATHWGGQRPDPVKFAAMLRAVYPRIKAADPDAVVIAGGLSTAGDGVSDGGYGDLLYIKNMYVEGGVKGCSDGQGGQRSCFDALGSHPYGGPFAPETPASQAQYTVGMYFRRAEQQKQMMDVWGQDHGRGIWATEFSWLVDPAAWGISCSWGSTWDSYKLTGTAAEQEAKQADYLVRAYRYAYDNWPWMQGMLISTLDLKGNGICDQLRWHSLTKSDDGDQTRRPAYHALAAMQKPGLGPAFARFLPALRKSSSFN